MFKATIDDIVFECSTAQDLGIAVASYKNSVFAKVQENSASSSASAI